MDYLLNGLPYFPGSTIFGTGLFADGTAAAPSIAFSADTDTGFYRFGANSIGCAVGGSALFQMFRFGGVAYLENPTAANSLQLSDTGSVRLFAGGTAQNITLTPSTTGYTILGGNVGIGTSTPTEGQLQISGNSDAGSGASRPRIALTNLAGTGVQWTIQPWSTSGDGNLRFLRSSGASGNYIFSDGKMLLGTTNDSGALLQVGTDLTTTNAGGIVLGTGIFLFRSAANVLTLQASSGTACTGGFVSNLFTNGSGATMFFGTSTADSVVLRTNNTAALTLDSSQNAAFAGWIKPRLATTAGAPAYVKGALYFDTTLNKLRVGGATAWETITSA